MLRRPVVLFLALLIGVTALSCAKTGKKAEKPVTTGFSSDVNVQYGDMTVKGHIQRSTAGTMTMDVQEPETLKGLSMVWNGESVSLKLHGLSFNVNPDTVPQSALVKSVLQTLDSAMPLKEDGELTDEGLLTTGSGPAGDFTLLSDPETGNLKQLSIPSIDLVATFSNFTLVSATDSTTTA